jgi:hypothetical protein
LLGRRIVSRIICDADSPIVINTIGLTPSFATNNALVLDDVDVRQERGYSDAETVIWVIPSDTNLTVQSMMVMIKCEAAARVWSYS